MTVRNKILFTTIALILVVSGISWILAFLQIDKCLDGGKRWNYEEQKCVGTQPSSSEK